MKILFFFILMLFSILDMNKFMIFFIINRMTLLPLSNMIPVFNFIVEHLF